MLFSFFLQQVHDMNTHPPTYPHSIVIATGFVRAKAAESSFANPSRTVRMPIPRTHKETITQRKPDEKTEENKKKRGRQIRRH